MTDLLTGKTAIIDGAGGRTGWGVARIQDTPDAVTKEITFEGGSPDHATAKLVLR